MFNVANPHISDGTRFLQSISIGSFYIKGFQFSGKISIQLAWVDFEEVIAMLIVQNHNSL